MNIFNWVKSLLTSLRSNFWKAALLLVVCVGCNKMLRPSLDKEVNLTAADLHKTWKDYGGGPDQSKYVDFKQINKSNVAQLKVA